MIECKSRNISRHYSHCHNVVNMVSKPKPGLGKGLVRTIQHGQHAYILPVTAAVKEKERVHSPKPRRQYATLSARPLDIVPFLIRPSFDFGARRDTTFNDLFPLPLPPSPVPHPIAANARSVHVAHAGGILQDAPPAPDITLTALPEQAQLYPSATYASRYIFKFGSCGLAKDRPIMPPRKPTNRTTPPPRPRSFPILDIQPPAIYNSISVGEDAYYARSDGMCMADGVGGWARSGRGEADAGKWSRLLTHFCEAEVRRWWDGKEEYIEDVMVEGWAEKLFAANVRFKVKLKAEDAAGLPQGLRRRKLDPVEIMQKGFEKCLSCFLKEVRLAASLADDREYTARLHAFWHCYTTRSC